MSQQINLISPLLLKTRYAFGLREMALGFGLILVGALAWAGFVNYQAGALESRALQQETLQAAAQQEVDQLSAAAARPVSALLTERVQAMQAQVAQHEALLESISSTIEPHSAGFAARMRALAHGHTEGVWLNGFTLSPDYVALKGSALNAGLLTTYLERLGRQAPFSGLQFSGMKAQLSQSADRSSSDLPAQAAHIDFDLYSDNRPKRAEQGGAHDQ